MSNSDWKSFYLLNNFFYGWLFCTLCLYLYMHRQFCWRWGKWLLMWRDKAWLSSAATFFTQPLQIVLTVHIMIMWDWMGFKWGLKHMNYLFWYAQTLFVVTMATQLGPPTWNEMFCLPVNLSLECFVSGCITEVFHFCPRCRIKKMFMYSGVLTHIPAD